MPEKICIRVCNRSGNKGVKHLIFLLNTRLNFGAKRLAGPIRSSVQFAHRRVSRSRGTINSSSECAILHEIVSDLRVIKLRILELSMRSRRQEQHQHGLYFY